MRKRVFGSIFLTSLVTLLLTTGLLLLAGHAGLTNDMRRRLVTESSYLSAVDNIGEELEKFGSVYADRLTLVAQDGTVMYDNRTNASEMENHAVHAVQQRRQLVIGFALHRLMQVERFDRLEEQTGQPACQHSCNQQRQQDDQHNPR